MKKKILSVFVTLVLVVILLQRLDFDRAGKMIGSISLLHISLITLFYGLYLVLVNLRAKILIHSQRIGFGDLLAITGLHNMYNRILPFRTGEISYVYLLREKENLPAAEGTATLIVARIFDYIIISFMFLACTFFLYDTLSAHIKTVTLIMSAFLFVSFGILFYFTLLGNQALRVIEKILGKFGLLKITLSEKILTKGREVVESFDVISSRKTYYLTFLTSLALWINMFFIHQSVLKGMGIQIGIMSVVIGSTFAVLTNVLPIHGIAGFGTIETGWTIGYMMLGFGKDAAISSAFLVHLFILFCALFYGLLSYVYQQMCKRVETTGQRPLRPDEA